MPVVFVFVLGVVAGFALCLVTQKALKEAEAAKKARIAREEAAQKSTSKSKSRR